MNIKMMGLIKNLVLILSLKLVVSFPFPVEYLGAYQQFPPTQYSNSAQLRSTPQNSYDKRITSPLGKQTSLYGTQNFNAPITSIQEKNQREQLPALKIQNLPKTPFVHLQATIAEPFSKPVLMQNQHSNTFENVRPTYPQLSQSPVQEPSYTPIQKQWIQTVPRRLDGVPIEPVASTERTHHVLNTFYPSKHEQTHEKTLQNILSNNPAVKKAIATTKNQKRFMVVHPDGKVEHVDELDTITKKHPNYILVNGGTITPPQDKVVNTKQPELSVATSSESVRTGFSEILPGLREGFESSFYKSLIPLKPLQQNNCETNAENIIPISPPVVAEAVVPDNSVNSRKTVDSKNSPATSHSDITGLIETESTQNSLLPIGTAKPLFETGVVPTNEVTGVVTSSDDLSKNAETESEKQAQMNDSASSAPKSTELIVPIGTTASESKDSTNELHISRDSDSSSVTNTNNPTSCLDLSDSKTDDASKSSKDSASEKAFLNERNSQSSSNTKSEQPVEKDSNISENDSSDINIREKPFLIEMSDTDFMDLLTDKGQFPVVYFFFVPSHHDEEEKEQSKDNTTYSEEESQFCSEEESQRFEARPSNTQNNDEIKTEQSSEKETTSENAANLENESEEHSGTIQVTTFTYINRKGENITVTYNH